MVWNYGSALCVRWAIREIYYKRNLMIGYGHVGDALGSPVMFNLGDSTGAQTYNRKALAIGQEIYDADPNDSTAKFDLAAGLERLGVVDVPASGKTSPYQELF